MQVHAGYRQVRKTIASGIPFVFYSKTDNQELCSILTIEGGGQVQGMRGHITLTVDCHGAARHRAVNHLMFLVVSRFPSHC